MLFADRSIASASRLDIIRSEQLMSRLWGQSRFIQLAND